MIIGQSDSCHFLIKGQSIRSQEQISVLGYNWRHTPTLLALRMFVHQNLFVSEIFIMLIYVGRLVQIFSEGNKVTVCLFFAQQMCLITVNACLRPNLIFRCSSNYSFQICTLQYVWKHLNIANIAFHFHFQMFANHIITVNLKKEHIFFSGISVCQHWYLPHSTEDKMSSLITEINKAKSTKWENCGEASWITKDSSLGH